MLLSKEARKAIAAAARRWGGGREQAIVDAIEQEAVNAYLADRG
jgi:hypothetical protein